MSRVTMFVLLVFACGALGCGDDRMTVTDSGFDGPPSADGSVEELAAAPMIPWLGGEPPVALPELTPCPDGWRTVTNADGIDHCDPYPEGGALDCPAGEAHFPGEPGCAPVGNPCPAGDFSEVLPTDRPVVYVLAGAGGARNGTRSAPYSGFHDPGASFPEGIAVAIGKGTYTGQTRAFTNTDVYGACAAETILMNDSSSDLPYVVQLRNDSSIHDVTVGPSPMGGIGITTGDLGTIRGVVITGVSNAITAVPGSVDAQRVFVRDIRPSAGFDPTVVFATHAVTLRELVVDGHTGTAIDNGFNGLPLIIEDSVFRGITDGPSGRAGVAVKAIAGEGSAFRRILVEDGVGGLRIGSLEGAVTEPIAVEDVVIRNMAPGTGSREAELITMGMTILAPANVRRIHMADHFTSEFVFLDALNASFYFNGPHELVAEDLLFERTSNAVYVVHSGDVRLSRVRIAENRAGELIAGSTEPGLLIVEDYWGGPGDFELPEPTVSGTAIAMTLVAPGIWIRGVRRFVLDRAILEGAGDYALWFENGDEMALSDVLIRNVRSKGFGTGVSADDAIVSADRLVVEDGVGLAMRLSGVTATMRDVALRRYDVIPAVQTHGRGVEVYSSTGTFERLSIADGHDLGMMVGNESTIDITDLRIADVEEATCADCTSAVGGHGIIARTGGVLSVSDFVIENMATCGVLVAPEGDLDLVRGEITRSAIGACIQRDGYDTARLSDDVAYRDNESSIQATSLPVPEATPPPRSPEG